MTTYYLDLSIAKEIFLTRGLKEHIAINLTYISLLY